MFRSHARVRRQTLIQGLVGSGLCWAVLSTLCLLRITEVFDLKLLDWRFRLRGERPASESIVVVGVDDATISAYGTWPLDRDAYALLITALTEGGARAVGVDLQFQSEREQNPKFDALLAYATAESPTVVQAMGFFSGAPDSDGTRRSPGVREALRRQSLVADENRIPEASGMLLPYPELCTSAHALGHTNVSVDRDGAIRRIPFFIRHGNRVFPALSLRTFGVARGDTALPSLHPAPGGMEVAWKAGTRLYLPMDHEGATGLDFAGAQTAFPSTISMLRVLQWYRAQDLQRLREAVDGRIVLVGLTAMREAAEDIGTTPFSTATPLLYVHANALDNCLRGRFLHPVSRALLVVLLGALALSLGWLYTVLSVPRSALAAGAVTLALAGIDQGAFGLFAIDVPPLLPLALPFLSYAVIGSTRHLFLEKRSREREIEIRQGRIVQQRFLPEAMVGQVLSSYRITGQLGRGGMGIVYLAQDIRLGREVAVKVLPGGALADEAARRRFRREARVLSRLSHPHTARLYEFDSQDGMDFLVIEYVHGHTLAERLRQGPLAEMEILRLGRQILGALREAHAKDIVHRDLKPANIMVTATGDAKILDFGLARVWQSAGNSITTELMTEPESALGTLPYMAPEILQRRPADRRTDIYGLGMILYEMAAGRRPFQDDAPHELLYTILHQEPPEPRVLNRRISPGLERVILRALEKDPEDRYRDCGDLLKELDALAGDPET